MLQSSTLSFEFSRLKITHAILLRSEIMSEFIKTFVWDYNLILFRVISMQSIIIIYFIVINIII